MSVPEIAIACTLDGASYRERIDAIRALFARALKASHREGNSLHLSFDAAARADVEEFVGKEKTCCAFLDFNLPADAKSLHLTITVPDGVDAAELLAPFAQIETVASCGCGAKPPSRLTSAFTGLGFGAA